MLYPFKFLPVYKDYIWGGRNLSRFGKNLPEGKVAESWELACHSDGMSIIANGIFKGRTLKSMIDEFSVGITGDLSKSENNDFPLLIKLIDANDKLSVQVHPDDEYAKAYGGEYGKNEMWYILDAKPDAKLIYGLKPGVTKEGFEKAVNENRINDCLNYINVKAGDFINIPAGMVHAIGEGIVIAEIQQNSNSTYRIYDYDRKDSNGNYRPLHIEKAMQVIDFHSNGKKILYEGLEYETSDNASLKIIVVNEYFCVELYSISGNLQQDTSLSQFHAYVCIDGEGKFDYNCGSLSLHKGETILIPSAVGKYNIEGNVKLLKTYVPELDKDIFYRLMNLGFTRQEIIEKIEGLNSVKSAN